MQPLQKILFTAFMIWSFSAVADAQTVSGPSRDLAHSQVLWQETEQDDSKDEGKKSNKKADSEKKKDDEKAEEKPKSRSSFFGSLFNRENEKSVKYSKNAKEFVSVFEPVVASASASTVKIMSGSRQVALGMVVDSDGFVLTKASELKGDLSCVLKGGKKVDARVYGIDPTTDLALLKLDAKEVNTVRWNDGAPPKVGEWVATPNLKSSKLEVGVIGVKPREIPPSRPFIGIVMDDLEDKFGVKIIQVLNRSPADEADILVGDILTFVDDIEIKNRVHLIETVGQYDPGDRVSLLIERAGKKVKLKLELAERDKISPANERSNQQNSMGSVLSRRRKNFPLAFQHDSGLNSNMCGGPVVNLDGQVIGMNIARAGRVSTLALPVESLLPVIESLKTGEKAPELVNKERIAEIDTELQKIRDRLGDLPEKKQTLETRYKIEQAKREELEKALKSIEDRLKVIELKADTFKTEYDSAKKELESIEKMRQRLERDRKHLATGVR